VSSTTRPFGARTLATPSGKDIEGAPLNNERALFTDDFAHSMTDADLQLYVRSHSHN
jgi:hypothetical protein